MSIELIETALVTFANDQLNHLEAIMADTSGEVESTDINSLFSEISGLIALREQANNGLSENCIKALNQVNIRALHLMGSLWKNPRK